MLELLRRNANRCLSLVVVEILVLAWFHWFEWSMFLNSELISLWVHLLLSVFGLCFFVIMRSKLKIGHTKRYSMKRIVWDSVLYLVFDFFIIHMILGLWMGEFEFHLLELSIIILLIYLVNYFFDTHPHHCGHDHCD